MTHIDEWIDRADIPENERYAAFFFMLHRLDAVHKILWEKQIKPFRLYCKWKGRIWRVTGCSRLGDVWLSRSFNRDVGYDERVDVAECSEWKEKIF